MAKADVYKLWLQSFFGLSYISPNEVGNGFVALMADAPYGAETFTGYILETFVDDNSSFPPYLWVENPSSDLKTTNGPDHFIDISIVSFIQAITNVLLSKNKYFIILE